MSFANIRIENDIKNLGINIPIRLEENELFFKLNPRTELYKKHLEFKLIYTEEYPFKSPKLLCLSKVYHPNIDFKNKIIP